jgi:superfamily II DNA/RNA helicase
MNSIEQLKQVLTKKRSQMDQSSEKAKYIDWLLHEEPLQPPKESSKAPNQRKASTKSSTQKKAQASFLTTENFVDRKDLHPASKRALTEVLKISSMTEIQSKTFTAASSGKDVLGRARTGTGTFIFCRFV